LVVVYHQHIGTAVSGVFGYSQQVGFVCLDDITANKVCRHAGRMMDDGGYDEDDFGMQVASLGPLLDASKGNAAVWRNVFDDE
jgi:hypothetical protein